MVYIVNYLPEELQALFDQPVVVGMAEPEVEDVKYILKSNQWQSLINDQTAAEYLSLLLNMKIPVAKNRKVNFKYSDKLIVFLLNQKEEEDEKRKIIVTYYKFVYVHIRPLSEVAI